MADGFNGVPICRFSGDMIPGIIQAQCNRFFSLPKAGKTQPPFARQVRLPETVETIFTMEFGLA
jgi:hypothetical protein